jgi:hypothetical protein
LLSKPAEAGFSVFVTNVSELVTMVDLALLYIRD